MALVSVAGENRAGLLYILGQVGGDSPQEQYCSNTGVIHAVLHFKAISTKHGDIRQDCHHAACLAIRLRAPNSELACSLASYFLSTRYCRRSIVAKSHHRRVHQLVSFFSSTTQLTPTVTTRARRSHPKATSSVPPDRFTTLSSHLMASPDRVTLRRGRITPFYWTTSIDR
jgi:hypothetical protein